MDDMLSISENARTKKIRRIIYLALILYFFGLFVHTINIANRKMPFFTKVVGYDSYSTGAKITMRVMVVGTKEKLPLHQFVVKLELTNPQKGESWQIFHGGEGGLGYVDILKPVPDISPGNYIAKLTTTHPEYGEEINEFSLMISPRPTGHPVEVQKLDEKFTKAAGAISAHSLNPPLSLHLLPGNGRFVPSLNNDIMVIAEETASGLPAAGLKIEVALGDKSIGEALTDDMGLADFQYYPHTLGGENISLILTDRSGKTFKTQSTLAPLGSQVVTHPQKYFLPLGENVRFKLETLGRGPWHIDMFHHGAWISSNLMEIHGAPGLVELPTPPGMTGLFHVQVASDFINPNSSFDAFEFFVYDPKEAVTDEDDPRLKRADPDDPKIADLMLEKPFKRLWSYMKSGNLYSRDITERWLRKINNLSLKDMPYRPGALAEQILREVNKDRKSVV